LGRPCDPTLPPVAVIMPILNETRHLRAAVAAVQAQDYRGPMEIVLALDRPPTTPDVESPKETGRGRPAISTVNNPTGATPCGLNAAIAASTHQIVVRVDGHAILPPDYVRQSRSRCSRERRGQRRRHHGRRGVTPFEQAVARAMRSRLGIGGSRFHVGGEPVRQTRCISGCSRRAILEQVGGFDESLRPRPRTWSSKKTTRPHPRGGRHGLVNPAAGHLRPRPDLPALAKTVLPHRASGAAG